MRTYGSVRGAASDGRPYRDQRSGTTCSLESILRVARDSLEVGKRWATTEDLSFRTPDSRRPGPKSDTAPLPPSGCLIAARSCRTRGAHVRAIADQRFHRSSDPTTAQRVSASPLSPEFPLCPAHGLSRSLHFVCVGGPPRVGARADAFSYCRSSSRSSSIAARKPFPQSPP